MSSINGNEALAARWTLGALLLAPLAATEFGYTTVPAILLLAAFIFIAAITGNDLKHLAVVLPPQKTSRGRRERNLQSFADFMGMWMAFLSHLVAVAICARILSATLDHVTSGQTRRWLFGFETKALGEPWPDVLGVTVVMVVCAMYMCGLEASMMFTFMLLGLLYLFSQCFAIFALINLDIGSIKMPITISMFEIFSAGAPIAYTFSYIVSQNLKSSIKSQLLLMVTLPMTVLAALCFLYTNMMTGQIVDAALPVTTLLESKTSSWVCPVLAAVTVAGVSLAFTELCPVLFSILVSLASSEWKVLTRSMTYESTTTGSPVLAVFTAGSLAAILAFACPLSHMITLMNASHLLGIAIQGLHFTIMRCVPTAEQKEAGDVAYKRLDLEASSSKTKNVSEGKRQKAMKFLSSLRHTKTIESIKSKVNKDAEDRECLLLDEYGGSQADVSGPSNVEEFIDMVEEVISDCDQSDQEGSSGDDSTDIDAVVKEYQDRVQVVTAKPVARAPVPPCVRGARLSVGGAILQIVANILISTSLCIDSVGSILLGVGLPLWLLATFVCAWQPAHGVGTRFSQRLQGPCTMLLAALFLTPLLIDSWPAILLFAGAGVMIYARCERWCGDLAVHQAREVIQKRAAVAALPTLAAVDSVYISR